MVLVFPRGGGPNCIENQHSKFILNWNIDHWQHSEIRDYHDQLAGDKNLTK